MTGEPVGSRTISDRFARASGWSAATIRNVMAELEGAGLVDSRILPRACADRQGYRFYVDPMLSDAPLSSADLAASIRSLAFRRAIPLARRII